MSVQQMKRILALNPKSESTEAALFENESCLISIEVDHLSCEGGIEEQTELRKQDIFNQFFLLGINLSKCAAVVGRGGLLRPLRGGTYIVDERMKLDLEEGFTAGHASSLGGWLASSIGREFDIPAFIVDPVTVDEFTETARITGIPGIERKSIFHALSHKAAARKAARQMETEYEKRNIIVLHLGGGITVGAHLAGQVIDVNNGLHGEGPLAPERAGTVPADDLISLCFSGNHSEEEIRRKISSEGGLFAYLGSGNLEKAEKAALDGDEQSNRIIEAMVYQSAKEIGAMATVLKGDVQAIVLTGRLHDRNLFVRRLLERIEWIADVFILPGENILESLASGALRALSGVEEIKKYNDGN